MSVITGNTRYFLIPYFENGSSFDPNVFENAATIVDTQMENNHLDVLQVASDIYDTPGLFQNGLPILSPSLQSQLANLQGMFTQAATGIQTPLAGTSFYSVSLLNDYGTLAADTYYYIATSCYNWPTTSPLLHQEYKFSPEGNIVVTQVGGKARVKILLNIDPLATHYNIYRCSVTTDGLGTGKEKLLTQITNVMKPYSYAYNVQGGSSPSTTPAQLGGILSVNTYYYRVVSVDSQTLNSITDAALDTSTPLYPSTYGVTLSSGSNSTIHYWIPPVGYTPKYYYIYYGTVTSGESNYYVVPHISQSTNTLNADLTAGSNPSTIVMAAAGTGFPSTGYVYIYTLSDSYITNGEWIFYSSLTTTTHSNDTLNGVVRAQFGTSNVLHSAASSTIAIPQTFIDPGAFSTTLYADISSPSSTTSFKVNGTNISGTYYLPWAQQGTLYLYYLSSGSPTNVEYLTYNGINNNNDGTFSIGVTSMSRGVLGSSGNTHSASNTVVKLLSLSGSPTLSPTRTFVDSGSYNEALTTLNGAITSSATSLTVNAHTGFPGSGNYEIQVDNEKMLVTAGQGTNTWTVTRGFMGTTQAAHSNAAVVGQTYPLFIRGARFGDTYIFLQNSTNIAANNALKLFMKITNADGTVTNVTE